jgi:hypothetical protein
VLEGLRKGRRYRIGIDADTFEKLLRDRPDIVFYEGEPRRQHTRQRYTRESAWRVDDTFILTLPAIQPVTVDPPALVIRYEADQVVHVHAQLSLGTWQDQLSQRGGELVRQGALRTGLVGVGTAVGLFTLVFGSIVGFVLTLAAGLVGDTLALVVMSLAIFLVPSGALFAFARTAFSPIVDHAELAWKHTLPRLTEMVGELLTPHILASVDTVRALPYRSPDSEESAA